MKRFISIFACLVLICCLGAAKDGNGNGGNPGVGNNGNDKAVGNAGGGNPGVGNNGNDKNVGNAGGNDTDKEKDKDKDKEKDKDKDKEKDKDKSTGAPDDVSNSGTATGNGGDNGNAGGGNVGITGGGVTGGTTGGGTTGTTGGTTTGGTTETTGGTTGGGTTGNGTTGGGSTNGGGTGDIDSTTGDREVHQPGRGGRTRDSLSLNGSYSLIIGGAYSGKGTATVSEKSMVIQADVTGPGGASGTLVSAKLLVDGPYLVGNATVLGQEVQISGRLDAAKAPRIIADFKDANGKTARIVGTLNQTHTEVEEGSAPSAGISK